MKKSLISYLLITTVTFIILSIILNIVFTDTQNITKIITEKLERFNVENTENFLTILKNLFSFISANIVGLINSFYSRKKYTDDKKPSLVICMKKQTILRKGEISDYSPCITLTPGIYFLYAIAEIKNIGNNNIREIYIDGILIYNKIFQTNQSIDIYFKIGKADDKDELKRKYKSVITIVDQYNKRYYAKVNVVTDKNNVVLKIENKNFRRDIKIWEQ